VNNSTHMNQSASSSQALVAKQERSPLVTQVDLKEEGVMDWLGKKKEATKIREPLHHVTTQPVPLL